MTTDWYQSAAQELAWIGNAVRGGRPVAVTELERISHGIAASLLSSDDLVVKTLSASPGDPLITNLVHVGILATKLGIGLNFTGEELEQLTLAGLLHDLGVFTLPPSLLSQSGKLTPSERVLLERHPLAGHDIVARLDPCYEWLGRVIQQAHERWAGQGYPFRLQGREIHEFAHVIGICDIFDALVSHRPYRRRLLPHEAIYELFQNERTSFPREILKALVEQLSVYPLGTRVRLNTGESAVVIRLNPRYPLRPVVQLEQGPGPLGALSSAVLDLSAMPWAYVTDTLKARATTHAQSSPGTQEAVGKKTDDCLSEFASLLDSLDAIASTIQEAVDSRLSPSAGHRSGEAPSP